MSTMCNRVAFCRSRYTTSSSFATLSDCVMFSDTTSAFAPMSYHTSGSNSVTLCASANNTMPPRPPRAAYTSCNVDVAEHVSRDTSAAPHTSRTSHNAAVNVAVVYALLGCIQHTTTSLG